LCGALGVSRGGFYAWLTRPRSRRSQNNEELSAKVRASFLASDRTYGARRAWRDLTAEGVSCGLHRIERLMGLQALRARPRRRRLPVVVGKIMEKDQYSYGFDAQSGEYGNLVSKGIIDPTKVVRCALQDGASVAGLLITTEAMVAEMPKKESAAPGMPGGGGMGGMDY